MQTFVTKLYWVGLVKWKGFCLKLFRYFGCTVDEVRECEWYILCAMTDEHYELDWMVGNLQPC